MTRKQKRLSRKQIKQQRAAEKARLRQQRGWEPPTPNQPDPWSDLSQEEVEALTSLLSSNETAAINQTGELLFNSGEWIGEPEFATIFFPPTESTEAFISAIRKRGFSPDIFAELDEDAQDDLHFEIMQEIVAQLLTTDKRQEIMAALDALNQRWRRQQKKKQAAQVTLVKLLLRGLPQEELSADAWQMAGLVQALMQRSIGVGFELMETARDTLQLPDDDVSMLDILENLPPEVEKKAGALFSRLPGLRSFLEKQTDEMWDEGLGAVYAGDLYLRLFSRDELLGAAAIMRRFVETAEAYTEQSDKIPKKLLESLVRQVDEYVVGLMTPARVAQLRARLREIIKTEEVDRHWMPFISLLHGYFQEEDAVENERPFLDRAIIGELRVGLTDEEE